MPKSTNKQTLSPVKPFSSRPAVGPSWRLRRALMRLQQDGREGEKQEQDGQEGKAIVDKALPSLFWKEATNFESPSIPGYSSLFPYSSLSSNVNNYKPAMTPMSMNTDNPLSVEYLNKIKNIILIAPSNSVHQIPQQQQRGIFCIYTVQWVIQTPLIVYSTGVLGHQLKEPPYCCWDEVHRDS